jgi:hypothetical protein
MLGISCLWQIQQPGCIEASMLSLVVREHQFLVSDLWWPVQETAYNVVCFYMPIRQALRNTSHKQTVIYIIFYFCKVMWLEPTYTAQLVCIQLHVE